jgi:hypothetical protein
MKQLYIFTQKKSAEYKTRRMMTIKGEILTGDHTFKVAKVIVSKQERLFEAQYSLMNEHSLVLGFWFTVSKSLYEIENHLKKVAGRYGDTDGPKVFYTDLCCPEREFLGKIFPSLSKDPYDLQEVLKFPGEIICSRVSEVISTFCDEILE